MGRIIKILGIITVVALLLGGGAMIPVAATPEVTVSIDTPNEAAPLPAKPINWPMLWGIIGGVVVVGLIIFLLARRKAY